MFLGASIAYAEPPKVSINGPSTVEPGQLVVLTAVGEATNYLWIPDSSLGQVLQCNPTTIGIATPRLGVHKVILVGSNEKGEMSFSTHVLSIEKQNPNPDPDPKPDPKPPTVGDYANLHKLSLEGAKQANDPVTALQLQTNLNRLLPELVKASSIDLAKQMVTSNVEATLLFRSGVSKTANWVSTWRKPLFEELRKYEFKSTTDFANAIKAIASGITNTPLCIECIK